MESNPFEIGIVECALKSTTLCVNGQNKTEQK